MMFYPLSDMFSFLKGPTQEKTKLPALFCMTCFEEGKSPYHYSLNRNNKSTKVMHAQHQHGTSHKMKDLVFCNPKLHEAVEALNKWKNFKADSIDKVSSYFLICFR